jgi:AcrR family transcriptional regulator
VPRDTLTREQIIRAAIDLLDTEGLEGLSMRALGQRLRAAATAVYWHVGSKENLIALASDQAWNEIPLPDLEIVGWREAAKQMATGLYAMLTQHTWLLQAFGSFLILSAGKARHDDCSLAIFEAAGFVGARADQAATIVFTYVLGNALGPAAVVSLTRKLDRSGSNASELIRANRAKARELAAQFPRLRSRVESGAAEYGAAPENSFEVGLEVILDSLEAQLTQNARPS